MAQTKEQEKDIVARLSEAGEDAVQRLSTMPGGKALIDTAHSFRERLDDLAVKIRALDPLEKRVAALEKRMSTLEKKVKPAAQKPAETKPKADA